MQPMLIVRNAQMELLARLASTAFYRALCERLKISFPRETAQISDDDIHRVIAACVERARGYGLHKSGDIAGFVTLAAQYGWDFDSNPRTAWMHSCLVDPDVSDAGCRLELLIRQCRYRKTVENHNRGLRQQLGLPPF